MKATNDQNNFRNYRLLLYVRDIEYLQQQKKMAALQLSTNTCNFSSLYLTGSIVME